MDLSNSARSLGRRDILILSTYVFLLLWSFERTGKNITQRDIAQAAGIADVTLRNTFKDLTDKLQLN
jgi:transcription initiation factor TFIIIB Brf1 subunit/transcription initiation factor TFIIB